MPPRLGELDGVVGQVEEDLRQGAPVGPDGELLAEGADVENASPLPSASGRSDVGHLLDHVLADDRLELEFHLARLDLGQVEQVVDQRQQVLAAGLDGPQLLVLIGG